MARSWQRQAAVRKQRFEADPEYRAHTRARWASAQRRRRAREAAPRGWFSRVVDWVLRVVVVR